MTCAHAYADAITIAADARAHATTATTVGSTTTGLSLLMILQTFGYIQLIATVSTIARIEHIFPLTTS